MKVLVLTLSFGSGHVSAARTMAQEVTRQAPDAEVRVVDALAESRELFRACYAWPYWAMIRYAPSLWERLFRARVARSAQHTAPAWVLRWGCSPVFKGIAEFKPEVIIATEVAACEMAVMARRAGLTSARIVNVITDHEAEPIWVQPEVEIYAVADDSVSAQLCGWGALSEKIVVCGIPTDAQFGKRHNTPSTRTHYQLDDTAPVVLLMSGGMGPARLDQVAARLCESDEPMQVVAITGHDARMRRRIQKLGMPPSALRVLGWIDNVASLMQTACVLVTKPGGLTIAEAALSELPVVMFDAIPGPELRNAERVAAAGAGVVADGPDEAVGATLSLLRDEHKRKRMSASAKHFSRPDAANEIARLVLHGVFLGENRGPEDHSMNVPPRENAERDNPVLILTISNGAGHIRVAQGIAAQIREVQPSMPVMIADVADYMKAYVRFTHITAYLWIVKHAPSAWDRIDRYQKRQPHTSPEWFYRHGCQPLFELARKLRPRAIVAMEVGCCEIAALMKRDLGLTAPLVAVNDDYDADRAWVQPEVDLYCFVSKELSEELISNGAPPERIAIWGAPLSIGYGVERRREDARAEVCHSLNLDPSLPLVLIAGGGEGMGQIEETAARLLQLQHPALQLVVLTGRNEGLRSRCERLSQNGSRGSMRVLGWTESEQMAQLMGAADLMVSKLGSMFNEAIASELPIIALEPPPGAERVQYRLLEKWKVGCALRTLDDVVEQVGRLLSQPQLLVEMREQCKTHYQPGVSQRIARWICEAAAEEQSDSQCVSKNQLAVSA